MSNDQAVEYYPQANLAVEYHRFIEELAKRAANMAYSRSPKGFAEFAKPYIVDSRWMNNINRKEFAYKRACQCLYRPIPHFMPSDEAIVDMIASHVGTFSDTKIHCYKIFFTSSNRYATVGEINLNAPDDVSHTEWFSAVEDDAANAVREIFNSWQSVGLTVPLVEIVAIDSDGKRV